MTTLTFTRVCAASELAEGTIRPAVLDGVEIAVVRTHGKVYAIHDECSHEQVALSEGELDEERTIECSMHGSRFDLATGRPIGPPATEPVPVYPAKIEGDDVLVAVPVNQEST
jgi:3-phenylpropionate/trans-cinnamate dioxygenase ferredoxin component